jgi:hypothetical protein
LGRTGGAFFCSDREIDPQRLNAFLVVRGLLDRGRASADGTGPGMMVAVVLFDLAVETAAKAVRAAHPPSDHPGRDYLEKTGELAKAVRGDLRFPRMLDDLLAALRLKETDESLNLPDRDNVKWLHEYRNGVQHQANEPSARDVERSAVYATDFIDSLLAAFYEISLAELSRASLVLDEDVRRAIQESEEHAGRQDFNAAMERLAIAFELARSTFRSGEPYRRRLRARGSDIKKALSEFKTASTPSSGARRALHKILDGVAPQIRPKPMSSDVKAIVEAVFPQRSGDPRRLEKLLADMAGEVERVEERLEAVAVAGDPSEYAWFRQRVPKPTAFAGNNFELDWHTIPPDPPADQREYLRALEFVTSTALRWQQFPQPEETEGQEGEETQPDPLEALGYDM